MIGGARGYRGRQFTVVALDTIKRESIIGYKKGILKFNSGEEIKFVLENSSNKNQEIINEDERYTLINGRIDSTAIDPVVIRIRPEGVKYES